MVRVQVNRLHSYTGHRDSVYTLQPSHAPHLFFSGAGDGMIVSWNMETPDTGSLIARLPNSVYALHYHTPTGLLIAGHNYDGIHLLEWENKKEVGSLHLTTAALFDVQSNENWVYVATGEGQIIMVELQTLNIKAKTHAVGKNARCIAVHAGRGEIAVGYSDNFIRIFDAETLQLKHECPAHRKSVFSLKYAADGKFLFSGSRDARLKVWDVEAAYVQAAEVVAHMYAINHVEFSPDCKHFVTCSMDKSIKVWDAGALKLLKVIDKARHAGHGTSVNKLLWTSYRSQLLSASDDRTISAWDINFIDQDE